LERLSEREYAVLLTDKNLPGMSGIELLKKAKQDWPLMEVLVITGFASVDSALEAIGEGAFDYIPKPLPSFHYLGEKIRGALAQYDFEVRIKAMVDYLSQTFQAMVQNMADTEKAEWVKRVEQALSSYEQQEGAARVLVLGPRPLANTAELLGYQVTRVESMKAATAEIRELHFQVVVFNEEEGGMLGAEAARVFHKIDPDLGVFVIAREGSLNQVVSAIGVGVGDYLIRPMEGREYFGPRLSRLISRQQRVTRYRRLLDTLKQVNIDLLVSGTE
jgi:DNA-binding NtrC family response regulator